MTTNAIKSNRGLTFFTWAAVGFGSLGFLSLDSSGDIPRHSFHYNLVEVTMVFSFIIAAILAMISYIWYYGSDTECYNQKARYTVFSVTFLDLFILYHLFIPLYNFSLSLVKVGAIITLIGFIGLALLISGNLIWMVLNKDRNRYVKEFIGYLSTLNFWSNGKLSHEVRPEIVFWNAYDRLKIRWSIDRENKLLTIFPDQRVEVSGSKGPQIIPLRRVIKNFDYESKKESSQRQQLEEEYKPYQEYLKAYRQALEEEKNQKLLNQ